MITKKALLKAIGDLDHDIFCLAARIAELEKAQWRKTGEAPQKPVKRGRGRPRKNAK